MALLHCIIYSLLFHLCLCLCLNLPPSLSHCQYLWSHQPPAQQHLVILRKTVYGNFQCLSWQICPSWRRWSQLWLLVSNVCWPLGANKDQWVQHCIAHKVQNYDTHGNVFCQTYYRKTGSIKSCAFLTIHFRIFSRVAIFCALWQAWIKLLMSVRKVCTSLEHPTLISHTVANEHIAHSHITPSGLTMYLHITHTFHLHCIPPFSVLGTKVPVLYV